MSEKRQVLVTGATGTLGAATVSALQDAGFAVTGTYLRSEEKALKLRVEIGAEFIQVDLRDETSVEALFKTKEFKAVVHCAGSGLNSLLMRTSEKDWQACLSTNAVSAFLVAQAFLRKAKHGDDLLLVSSRVGEHGYIGQSGYAAAKGAVTGLMYAAAAEAGPLGAKVNGIFPAFVPSDMVDGVGEEFLAKRSDDNLLPESDGLLSFTSLVRWLLESEFPVSGQVFRPDCRI